ncbi:MULTISPECIES: hypothetical protein [Alphaproteobacteria]|uniref:hypothetical protein n=1 Tax=Alphaproteobacteria TaxID=28211 RepID=UPI0012BCA28A|nr:MULTISPECIES: hypothetical protein [Alphaproteobacteria]MTH99169.1 hypothetical protein [Roseibium sp. RKSG952]
MSDTITTLASKLAEDTMKVMDETGQDRFYVEVGELLGASSQSLEEAYLTEIRVRLAERKARQFVIKRLSDHRSKLKAIEKQ